MKTIEIGYTKKGARVWLQGLQRHGWNGKTPYTVAFNGDVLTLTKDAESKRKVTDSKGGVIDIVSKKVTAWAQGSTKATVTFDGPNVIEVRPLIQL